MHWYFLISSYYLTVSNGHSLTALKSVEFTQHSGSFKQGGPSAFGIYMFLYALVFPYIFLLFDCFKWYLPLVSTCFSMHWYFLISTYYLTVSNVCSLTALKGIEFTQCSGSFEWGVHLPLVSTCFLYALVFPYIFLLFDSFEWVLIDHIEKHRVHSALWQFQMGGGREGGFISFTQVNLKIWAHLPFDALLPRTSLDVDIIYLFIYL